MVIKSSFTLSTALERRMQEKGPMIIGANVWDVIRLIPIYIELLASTSADLRKNLFISPEAKDENIPLIREAFNLYPRLAEAYRKADRFSTFVHEEDDGRSFYLECSFMPTGQNMSAVLVIIGTVTSRGITVLRIKE